jgi:hypothetical protein
MFKPRTALAIATLLLAAPPGASARSLLSRGAASNRQNITLRKRLHVNTLITEPGTVEVEWGNLYSYTNSTFSMPSTIKFTPEGSHILWGRTEYSAAFDSVNSALVSGERSTQFSDRLTFAATSVVFDGEKLDIAIAPQATFFLRDESGSRLGATAIARYDVGRNSFGGTASWSTATAASPNNPAGTWDFSAGFGRRLAASGALGHLSPHVNAVYERSTGFERVISVFGGVEYQITEKVAVDVSGQRFGVSGGGADRQLLVALTVNLGKVR